MKVVTSLALALLSTVSFAQGSQAVKVQKDWNTVAAPKIDALIAVQEGDNTVTEVNYNCEESGLTLVCSSNYQSYLPSEDKNVAWPWNGEVTVTFGLMDGTLGPIQTVEYSGSL